jgi:hypothetical protein
MELKNETPHALAQLVELDRTGAEHLLVVLRAEFAIGKGGSLEVAPPLSPPRPADVFHGDPTATSIQGEAELASIKPTTDVLLFGSAVARRSGTRVMDVMFRVGPVKKVVRVYGERRWKRALLAKTASDPLPFERVPLIWENAWGGTDQRPTTRNTTAPSRAIQRVAATARAGRSSRGGRAVPESRGPDRVASGVLGARAPWPPHRRGWLPRRQYAGTHDEKWVAEKTPLPDDSTSAHQPPTRSDRAALPGAARRWRSGCTRKVGWLALPSCRAQARRAARRGF